MSDTVILRKIYALDSNTGLFISSNKTLLTDGKGGAIWTDMLVALESAGGEVIGYLPSTISTFSTVQYNQQITIEELQIGLSTNYPTSLTPVQLTSSLIGLGSLGYISSLSLTSTINSLSQIGYISTTQLRSSLEGVGSLGYISSSQLQSTIEGLGNLNYISTATVESSINSLSEIGYISSSQLTSTITGLGSLDYISSASLYSSINSLNINNFVSTQSLISTVEGLGEIGYISTGNLESTIGGLGELGYISSTYLTSTIEGLGEIGYISSGSLISSIGGLGTIGYVSSTYITSTIEGLGTFGYVSSATLLSTVQALQSTIPDVRFDNVGNVFVTNSVVNFNQGVSTITNPTLIYASSFSFITPNTQIQAQIVNTNDLIFSTATLDLSPFSNYIYSSTNIILDIFPTYTFSRLGTGATAPGVLPLSTMLQVGNTILSNTTTTSFVVANQCRISINPTTFIDTSNIYQAPIRLEIPKTTITNYTSTYTLLHHMPGGLASNTIQNALDNENIGIHFDSNRSIQITLQNV